MFRRQSPRPWIRAAIGITISVVFVIALMTRIDLVLLAKAWAEVEIALLVVAGLLSFIEVGVRAARWRILLSPMATVSYGTTLGYLSIGHLANALLPARLGDVARALITGIRLHSSRASVLGTIAVERMLDGGLLALAVATGVLMGYRQLAPTMGAIAVAGLAVVLVMLVVAVVLKRQSIAATRAGRFLRHNGLRFLAGAAALRGRRGITGVAVLTLASFGLTVIIFSTVVAAVGLSMPIWQAALVIAAVTLSLAVPAGPASIGTYEFVGTTVMTSMGFPAEQSLLCVALVHAVVVLPPSLMGLVAMWWLGVRPDPSRLLTGRPSEPTPQRAP